jgi:hypothetical protein
MDNQAVETQLKMIEDAVASIRQSIGSDNNADDQGASGNPMVTPEKPSMMAGMQLGK